MIGKEVSGISLAPKYQNRGMGRALMDHVAGSRSCPELDVFEGNVMARRFYESYGFRVVNEHVNDPTRLPDLRLRFDVVSA